MSFDPAKCVARLNPWDVIWPYDEWAHPPKWKMWVCVSKINLWFLRINTSDYGENCVLISKEKHPWLEYDSFVGCGGDLIDAITEDDLIVDLEKQINPKRQDILGNIDKDSRMDICTEIERSINLTPAQKEIIIKELRR